jgi:hypothetical protein
MRGGDKDGKCQGPDARRFEKLGAGHMLHGNIGQRASGIKKGIDSSNARNIYQPGRFTFMIIDPEERIG